MNENRERKVLLFPARRLEAMPEEGTDGGLFFLFSMGQVADVLKTAKVHPVPYSPPHIEGMIRWHKAVVPVVSPERCLLETEDGRRRADDGGRTAEGQFVMVRVPVGEGAERRAERVAFRTGGPVRLLPLPDETAPVPVPGWIGRADRVRGVYLQDGRYLIVLDIGKILADKGTD